MKIVCLDGYTLNPGDLDWGPVADSGELKVYDRTAPDQVVEQAGEAEILLTNKTVVTREHLAELPNLKYISVLATGFNIVDIDACREQGILVSNVPEYSTDSVAQLVMALVLAHCHRVEEHSRAVHDGAWVESPDFCFWNHPLTELADTVFAIVGFGRIGRRVGALAHAFGMKVLVTSRSRKDHQDYPVEWVSQDTAFERADVISLHCPQTEDNKGFVDRDLLSRMKPSALFINTARGPLVNEQDLADALNEGRIAGAAVDVVSAEPMKPGNPLLGAKNLLITPHLAWCTLAARKRLMQTTAENIAAFKQGQPINLVG